MALEDRYLDNSYLNSNPLWHRDDAEWKSNLVFNILNRNNIFPNSICEIGCGSGDILAHLRNHYGSCILKGFDISPQLSKFWMEHKNKDITFVPGDFHKINKEKFNVLCMLDVFEHVRDPFTFLEASLNFGDYFVFHIPLDLSAISVMRGTPLMLARKNVGHLHFYSKDLALETLTDSGYGIMDWHYTNASWKAPNRKLKTKLFELPRRIAYLIDKDFGVRLFGGETLIVLAKANK
jgi:hypothetical protein